MIGGWLAAGTVALALAASALAAVTPSPVADQDASGAVRQQGADLYLANCASCHGPQGAGTSAGPPLIGVGAASVDFYLRTGRMPLGAPGQQPIRQEPRFSAQEIAAIVDHVLTFGGDGPPIPQVRSGGDLQRGWELYTANCAACHAATGAGNAVGGGFVAVGLGQADDVEIAEAIRIGPGVMPRFSFAEDDEAAIIAYLRFLRSAPAPGGVPIGGIGPVAEGFVSVVVGLVAVTLVAMFVGRRSHRGEPADPVGAPEP